MMFNDCRVLHRRPVRRRYLLPGWLAAPSIALLLALPWPASADTEAAFAPLIQVAPAYPEAARRLGVEGHVELEMIVDPRGTVSEAAVIAADPSGVFEEAALQAAERWRYAAQDGRAPQRVIARLDFRIEEAALAATAGTASERTFSASRRSECVRENATYHYGDVVELDLVNTCDEPLLVYGCAPGTGGYSGRWVCFDSEQQSSVLVRANDRRLGDAARIETLEGTRMFSYAQTFHMSRAPNSQYWWVACHAADAACRGTARQWAQSVNLQPDRVNPQHRTHLRLARST